MNKIIALIVISVATVFPYFVMRCIINDFYPLILNPVVIQMMMLIPMMIFSIYGFPEGVFSGIIFSVSLLTFNVLYSLGSGYTTILVLGLLINPLTNGIAAAKMNEKHIFPIYLGFAIVIQVFFRTVFAA